ncbi:hypothetical protein L1280_001711 [Deinococcus sp. HSC-46F16]|uniref:hypothetical protein n=1 Tax=Deinococcus sp. HSC-46F16 TaxID=2910968 RepID=UPI00209E5247|nr:hypothetical protein [Deinococcus sp. HSC-46F16]MCP2014560.1 hypothetical protein [Deinococcus sp. HSC-46F16]
MTADARTDRMTAFAQAVMALMVAHGVAFLRPQGGGGALGLTESGEFVTRDLAFEFLAPGDHRAAAAALGVAPVPGSGPRGMADMQAFVRAVGRVYDEYGVQSLDFGPGARLGFRPGPSGMTFVTEGVALTLRREA